MTERIYYLSGKEKFISNIPMRALLYGEGVFETFRCINYSLPVFYERHISRLLDGCSYFSIPVPNAGQIGQFILESLNDSRISDAYVKICVLSSGNTNYYAIPEYGFVILIVREYPEVKDKVRLTIAVNRRNSQSSTIYYKSLNYLENILIKRRIRNGGFDEAIILNERDVLTECITHNIFWFSNGKIYTPAVAAGLLNGITRSLILEIAESSGFEVKEGYYGIDDMLSAPMVFITNSITGIAEVNSVSGSEIGINEFIFKKLKQNLYTVLGWA